MIGKMVVGILVAFFAANDTFAETTIQLDQPVHFLTTEGQNVTAPSGGYVVQASGDSQMVLMPTGGGPPLTVGANAGPHQETLSTSQALVIAEEPDAPHVVLLLPEGRMLDARGSISGIHQRGAYVGIGRARIHQELTMSAAIARQPMPRITMTPQQGPSGTAVQITAADFPAPPPTLSPSVSREADVFLDQRKVQTLRLQPCSRGGIGLGPDCGTPPLTITMDGPPGIKKTVRIETLSNILLGSQSATGMFTVDVAPAVGQTQITAPTLTLFPTDGASGTLAEASACGFPATLERQLAKISVEGRVAGTAILGRCPDGSAGFGTHAIDSVGQGLLARVAITIDGQPGPKPIRVQVDTNPGPPATTAFQIHPLPPVTFAPRFQLMLGALAVLDKETGLTWERVPEVIANNNGSFQTGRTACHKKAIGGRVGWRLPTLDELASLVDRTQQGPALAPGHPFLLPQAPTYFWTTTGDVENATSLYILDMRDGVSTLVQKSQSAPLVAWCVRGIPGPDQQ